MINPINLFNSEEDDDVVEHSHIEHDDPLHKDKKIFDEQITKDLETIKIERQCLTFKSKPDNLKKNK